jgi:hypothetical protein
MKQETQKHWKTGVHKNMYPKTYALEHARDNLTLFAGDHGKFSVAALPRQVNRLAVGCDAAEVLLFRHAVEAVLLLLHCSEKSL